MTSQQKFKLKLPAPFPRQLKYSFIAGVISGSMYLLCLMFSWDITQWVSNFLPSELATEVGGMIYFASMATGLVFGVFLLKSFHAYRSNLANIIKGPQLVQVTITVIIDMLPCLSFFYLLFLLFSIIASI